MRLLMGFDGRDKRGKRYVVRCRVWLQASEVMSLIKRRRDEYANRDMPRRVRWPEYWDREEL